MSSSTGSTSFEPDDLATWASLATVLEWLPRALDAPLQQECGLTHFEYGILFALADAPAERLPMSELAGYANSSLSRLSRATSRLERRGWVRREPASADGRVTLAVLTADGLQQYKIATPVHEQNVQRLVLDGLSNTQKRELRDIAQVVMHAVQRGGQWPGLTHADARRERLDEPSRKVPSTD